MIGLRGLPEGGAGMSELAAGLQPGPGAQTLGARDFLPRRVGGGWQGGVVGVADDGRGAALDHLFQLVEAAQELVVELLLRE